MRVLVGLSEPTRRTGESGAIALLTAFLTVVVFGMAAFTVDFGIAYNSKRQLQTAADAGALAAVQVYKSQTGVPCATLQADLALKAQAQAAADQWAAMNRPGMQGTAIAISCSTAGLTVTYGTSADTATVFARVLPGNQPQQISTSRIAAATIGKPAAGGLRPWGVCSATATTLGIVVFVPMEGSSTTSQDAASLCGPEAPPGGWWVAQCTGQGNGNGSTEGTVLNGCPTPTYNAVPGQLPPCPTATPCMTPAQLYTHLTTACPSKAENSTCLASDNGNNFHNASDEWQTLVGQTFTMPVLCVRTKCTSLAVQGSGQNASYAIQSIATVELCGFKLNPRAASTGWPTTGACATRNPRNYTSSSVTAGGGLFVVIKGLSASDTPAWALDEYKDARLTK